MPRTKGTKQLFVEVTDTLLDQFKAFCESRGETLRLNLEMAMRRHMSNPPPPPVPLPPPPLAPLPPLPVSQPVQEPMGTTLRAKKDSRKGLLGENLKKGGKKK